MSYISTLWIKCFYHLVGVDQYGNQYFVGNSTTSLGYKKRYVIYKGIEDGSKVPAMWHAWLHYTINNIPFAQKTYKKYKWQSHHIQNLTGTSGAYKPSRISNSDNKETTYSIWKP